MLTIEHTDTFGGEANYCWVKRWKCGAELTDKQAIKLALDLAGLKGVPCRVENIGETIAIYPRRICQVVFINYAETDYAQGVEVNARGDVISVWHKA